MTPAPPAYLTGLRLLARRELTSAQLRERLLRRQIDPDEVDTALERLRAEGALDDRRAARAYASTAVRIKGRGRLRVARELGALGLEDDVVRAALDDAFGETDEEALVERAIDRRLRGPIRDQAHLRRLHQYLVRLGFPSAASLAALRRRRKG
jgi:regulatory protein